MNKFTKIILTSIILLLVVFGAIFGIKSINTNNNLGTIKIGAVLPLTGGAAEFGEWMRQGMEIATEKINKDGGIKKRKIEIIFEDSAGDAKTGLSAYNKLMLTENIKGIFSAISGVTLAILPNAIEDDIPIITSSTHPKITNSNYPAIRIYFTPEEEANAMANFAFNNLNKKRIAIIYLNDESLSGYNNFLVAKIKELGGETFSQNYNFGDSDFRTQLTKIKEWQPDAIYVGGWKENGTIVKQIKELGIECQILGPITFGSPQTVELAGESVNGAIFTTPAFDLENTENKELKYLKNEYNKLHAKDPDVNVAIYYSGLQVFAQAILNLDEEQLNTNSILSEIKSLKNFETAMGNISFKDNGDIIMPIGFKIIQNGEFMSYK